MSKRVRKAIIPAAGLGTRCPFKAKFLMENLQTKT